ncbi:tripartite tricarboxylate transporter substrate binding protein [Bradyrhizobium sp. LHD-71]|uniref:Bug family tripartite tricarboxylate transporter substrate binding protein n=1 Tax=Bradyrhizobium sp. LHD-71 TaxID=3072141 RepID=UPI00280EAF56|nr:tripartite tricarboxylate transporter substrate binding protein [Bradyrhizobium sp. LHD-71]MDQ8729818.1 tripartite tricarboxylate transporter substrate binding protein [Bradyrhizobium sp. LHD-71]
MAKRMNRRALIATGTAIASSALLGWRASAQAGWPTKPVRVVCGYPPGGSTDVVARAYSAFLSRHFGQPFVVENKGGGSGTVGALDVKQARPDGYTLMASISTTMIQNRVTMKNLSYDPERDFEIVTIVAGSGSLVVVQPDTGISNLKEFVEFAKKADKLSMATYAIGSTPHLVASELNQQYGLKIEPIHYRGEAPMWSDFMAGSTDIGVGSTAPTLPVLQAGRGKLIASVGTRNRAFPDVPTLAEQGLKPQASHIRGYVGFWAPAQTPEDILEKLSEALVLGGKDSRVQQATEQFHLDPAIPAANAKKRFTDDSAALIAALKQLNIQPE